ncbi:MAG: dolichyl-phosphate beta-glucosyltransferase [Candidatus Bathyarchaeia archaeon]
MQNKLSIIIPSFNEEGRIKKTLQKYYNHLLQHNDAWEIIVVMDGCNDRTSKIVAEFTAKRKNVRFLEFPHRLGKGGAFLKSLSFAQGDFLGYVDADGSTEANEFLKLVTCIESEGWDGVIGSRWVDDAGIVKEQTFFRKFLSRGLNALIRMLFGLKFKDTQCGAKVFRRVLIEACLPYICVTGFIFDVNLLYIATKKGFKVKEHPLQWRDVAGSRLDLKDVLTMFWDICRLRLKSRCFGWST